MAIFDLPLEQVDVARLAALVTGAVREDRQLDYKEKLPGGTDDEKREFLSDVTSFANAVGGDILYGVKERHDAQGNLTGEPDQVVGLPTLNVNGEQLRLENLLRDGVAPRLPRVTFREIRRDPDPSVLLLRVPRSWAGPHMVIFKNLSRFFSRNSSGKYQLDVTEIRVGFLASATAQDRVRGFRVERIARIVADQTPVPMGSGPRLIFHALPVGTSDDAWQRFGNISDTQISQLMPPLDGALGSSRFTLDGFVVATSRHDVSRNSYVHLFRDGGIEAVSGASLGFSEQRGGFDGLHVERTVIGGFTAYRHLWEQLAIEPPIMLGLALTGVKGKIILPVDFFRDLQSSPIDADPLVIPESVAADLSGPAPRILRPLFDLLWNAGGWARSPYYNDSGERREP